MALQLIFLQDAVDADADVTNVKNLPAQSVSALQSLALLSADAKNAALSLLADADVAAKATMVNPFLGKLL